MWVFDLDGTLVDTREAVRQAYLAAGVKMPEEAWGRPWREWLEDEGAHALKNFYYPEALRQFAQPLPLLQYALTNNSPVITGASSAAVYAIQRIFGPLNVMMCGANERQKYVWLAYYHNAPMKDCVYVDDDPKTRALISRSGVIQWTALSPDEALLRLSLRRARTDV